MAGMLYDFHRKSPTCMYCFQNHFFVQNQILICFRVNNRVSTIQWLGWEDNVLWWADGHFPIAGHLSGMGFFILNGVTVDFLTGKNLYLVSYFTFSLRCVLGSWPVPRGRGWGGLCLVHRFPPLLLWPFLLLLLSSQISTDRSSDPAAKPRGMARSDWLK